MLFNSLHFLIFFPIVLTIHFLLPASKRWLWLIIASSYFYMVFSVRYMLVIYSIILIDYGAGILIEKFKGTPRRLALIVSLAANIGILCFFKYFNFFNGNATEVMKWFGFNNPVGNLDLLLPIGLSFHTFQSMSYTIEVYRGNFKAERHFGIYALYVLFFPQLVAGPIERPQNVIPQLRFLKDFEQSDAVKGLRLMIWGFFKKIVIADRLALIVDHVYSNPNQYGGAFLIVATIAFALQIYCDFSGYSDIALGTARILRVKLMINFNSPYCAKSVAEFWGRWHISLSTWFRDYLYIPLGGNRVSRLRWYFNLLVTFLISGLWHGANWTYVIWGGLNGAYLILGQILAPIRTRVSNVLHLNRIKPLVSVFQIILTFIFICFAWIFFRARTVTDAWSIVIGIFDRPFLMGLTANGQLSEDLYTHIKDWLALKMRWDATEFVIAILAVLVLEAVQWLQRHKWRIIELDRIPQIARLIAYEFILLIIIAFGSQPIAQKFIYFQF